MIKQQISRGILWGARMLCIDGLIPDKLFLQLLYRRVLNQKLNLKNPKTFNEKLQWLKLYDHRPEYTTMVDKYAVKEYVANIIGEKYIIPTLGVWNKTEDIDWDNLPDQFVLKCTHDSGGLVICRNKSMLNMQSAMKKLSKSLKNDYYLAGREWPYKNVPRRIIAEELLGGGERDKNKQRVPNDLRDYKFFCFNGECHYFKIDFDRETHHKANYYNRNLELMHFGEKVCPPDYDKTLYVPNNISEMISMAEIISKNIPFVRVDFYNIEGSIYFGECTFFPAAGLGRFIPNEWDQKLGDLLILP